ncbi:MAG: hypothetical protein RL328_1117 [Acidobacteriota bacterium]|jgi:hypothetical protein
MQYRKLLVSLFFPLASFAAEAIQVPVWPAEGTPLSTEGLVATIGGEPADVLGVQAPADDLMLLVVLDLTDDLALVEQARNALIERIENMPANHLIGVLSAQNGLRVLAEPTSDHAKIAEAIRSQKVGGRAGLLETVEEASRIATSVMTKSGVRVAVLYVTDSDVNNYREAFDNPTVNRSDQGDVSRRMDSLVRERMSRVSANLGKGQAPVFIAHLSYRTDQLNVAYQTGMISLTAATGGNAMIARSNAEIPQYVTSMVDHIAQHYSVKVAVKNPQLKKADVALESNAGELEYRTSYQLN